MSRILLLAVVCRVAIVWYAERAPEKFDFPDSRRYVQVARNMADGLGPIDSPEVRSGTDPVYPAILALGIKLGCETDAAIDRFARVVNAIASVFSVALIAGLGRRLVGDRAGLIAAAILAVDPILLFFNALVLTETLYILTLLAALTALVRLLPPESAAHASNARHEFGIVRHRALPWLFLAGIVFGLGALTRSTSFLLPMMMAPVAWRLLPRKCRAAGIAVFLAAFILILTPNIIRNARLFGHFVPVRTGGGAALLEALGPWADGAPGMDRIVYPPTSEGANEYERDIANRRAAWQWTRENPAQAARLAIVKLVRTWSPMMHAPEHSSAPYQALAILTVVPVYLLALGGICVLRGRGAVLALLLMPAVYFTLVHMVFVGSVRYRVPVLPMLFILAGAAIQHLLRHRERGGLSQTMHDADDRREGV